MPYLGGSRMGKTDWVGIFDDFNTNNGELNGREIESLTGLFIDNGVPYWSVSGRDEYTFEYLGQNYYATPISYDNLIMSVQNGYAAPGGGYAGQVDGITVIPSGFNWGDNFQQDIQEVNVLSNSISNRIGVTFNGVSKEDYGSPWITPVVNSSNPDSDPTTGTQAVTTLGLMAIGLPSRNMQVISQGAFFEELNNSNTPKGAIWMFGGAQRTLVTNPSDRSAMTAGLSSSKLNTLNSYVASNGWEFDCIFMFLSGGVVTAAPDPGDAINNPEITKIVTFYYPKGNQIDLTSSFIAGRYNVGASQEPLFAYHYQTQNDNDPNFANASNYSITQIEGRLYSESMNEYFEGLVDSPQWAVFGYPYLGIYKQDENGLYPRLDYYGFDWGFSGGWKWGAF